MKLKTLQDKVIASIRAVGLGVGDGSDVSANEIQMTVTHTVRALGLDINTQTGEIYNPAHEGKELFPRQQNVRYAGMPSRARGKR